MLIKTKSNTKLYLLIAILMAVAMATFTFPEALDIGRYYMSAKIHAKHYSVIEYIGIMYNSNIDFIYFTALLLANKLSLPSEIVTFLFLTLYYVCICEMVRLYSLSINLHNIATCIMIFIMLSAPFVWVQTIGRNLGAIALLYWGILCFFKGENKTGIILCIASIFTHFSMAVYIILAIIAYYIQSFRISRAFIIIAFVISIFIGIIVPRYLMDLFYFIAGSADNHYGFYANFKSYPPILNPNLGIGDKFPMIFTYLFSIYIILKNKRQDFFFWMLFIYIIGLSFSLFIDTMLTQRFIMCMPLFLGCNVCSVLRQGNISVNKILQMFCIIGLVTVALHLYTYRLNFAI